MRKDDKLYFYYKAIINGNGYSDQDKIVRIVNVNTLSENPDLILETRWFNQTTLLDISEPIDVDLIRINQ